MKNSKFKNVFEAGGWRRNRREVVKLSITLIDENYFVSIRAFAVDAMTGDPVATKQGIAFPLGELPELVTAGNRALRRARKRKWLSEEDKQ